MKFNLLVTMMFFIFLHGSVLAKSSMDEVRMHLEQANELFCEASINELEKWENWVRTMIKKDKQSAKQWLKDKIDHC